MAANCVCANPLKAWREMFASEGFVSQTFELFQSCCAVTCAQEAASTLSMSPPSYSFRNPNSAF